MDMVLQKVFSFKTGVRLFSGFRFSSSLFPLSFCLFLCFLTGCYAVPATPRVCFEKICYHVDVALTSDDRERGLMFHKALFPSTGMLFIFEDRGRYPFWMKNMTFAIDILWIDENKKVVHVAAHVPPCVKDPCPVYDPGVSAKYVLEIPAGDSTRHALVPGSSVTMVY